MNDSRSKRSRHRLLALIACLIAESLAVAVVRSTSWNQLGAATRLAGGGIILGLPLLFAGYVLIGGRARFGMKHVLALITLVAIVLASSLVPLQKFRTARRITSAMNDVGMSVCRHDSRRQQADALDTLPFWVREFGSDLAPLLPDHEVTHLAVEDDVHLILVLENLTSFPNLSTISLCDTDRLRDDLVRQLLERVSEAKPTPGLQFEERLPRLSQVPPRIDVNRVSIRSYGRIPPEFIGNRFETLDHFEKIELLLFVPQLSPDELAWVADGPVTNLILRHLWDQPDEVVKLRQQYPNLPIQTAWPD